MNVNVDYTEYILAKAGQLAACFFHSRSIRFEQCANCEYFDSILYCAVCV